MSWPPLWFLNSLNFSNFCWIKSIKKVDSMKRGYYCRAYGNHVTNIQILKKFGTWNLKRIEYSLGFWLKRSFSWLLIFWSCQFLHVDCWCLFDEMVFWFCHSVHWCCNDHCVCVLECFVYFEMFQIISSTLLLMQKCYLINRLPHNPHQDWNRI